MTRRGVAQFCGVVLLTGVAVQEVRAQASAATGHVDAARAAIAPPATSLSAPLHTFKALFEQACAQPQLPDQVRTNDRSAVLPRKEWFAWPANVFDNLYFIGTRTAGVWAIKTADGIIVVDANFHYSSTELVMGLLNFGLDPLDIKYVIVTHAHDDRYWGAKALQDRYPKARIAMSAADWDLVAKDNSPVQFKPTKDMVITDGQKITLGEVTVTAYITPGHTPGGTSWTWKSCERDTCQHMVYADSLNSVSAPGFEFSADAKLVKKFERSIDTVEGLKCDILITPHPEAFDLEAKAARLAPGPTLNPFIDSKACKAYGAGARERLAKRLSEERATQ